MTSHPEELAALLALPPAAREALARCEGPGWAAGGAHCYGDEDPRSWDFHGKVTRSWGGTVPMWLPCDTAAILSIVAGPCLLMSDGTQYVARSGPLWQTEARGETARLAALRLLAAVS